MGFNVVEYHYRHIMGKLFSASYSLQQNINSKKLVEILYEKV